MAMVAPATKAKSFFSLYFSESSVDKYFASQQHIPSLWNLFALKLLIKSLPLEILVTPQFLSITASFFFLSTLPSTKIDHHSNKISNPLHVTVLFSRLIQSSFVQPYQTAGDKYKPFDIYQNFPRHFNIYFPAEQDQIL